MENKVKEVDRLIFLMEELQIANSKLQPEDTGHIHTAIGYMNSRVEELRSKIVNA